MARDRRRLRSEDANINHSNSRTPRRITGRAFATRSEVIARYGMAATSQPLATDVALDILKQGGTAVDAAIAANAALGVMEPTGAGIGGDLFALVWDAHAGALVGLNASGRSPKGLTLEHLRAQGIDEIPPIGPLPVSVPGCVDGWFELNERFGRLPMRDVLAPAIHYARHGFPVSELIAHYWARGARVLEAEPGFARTFLRKGRPPAKGDVFKNPALANSLTTVADLGRKAFYRGYLAEQIDAFCRRVGCLLRLEDLAAHRSTWDEPVATTFGGTEVWELPPNGQGLAVLQMLNLLEPYDLEDFGWGTAEYLHHLIEAKKIAYEDRGRLYADPAFAAVPIEALASKAYAEERRTLLDPKRASTSIPAGDPKLETGDTVYLAVADRHRNMVSLVQSNYRGFGSGLCPDGLGFCLQDRGQLFSLDPDHPNVYAPGKRPFHTIIPGFVTKEGRPYLCFGVMGGDMQPQGHVQVLLNHLVFGMNVQEAGDAARFHHGGSSSPTGSVMEDGGVVALEHGFPAAVERDLSSRGHRIRRNAGVFGGYQAIRYDATRDVYFGASESRKDGQAAGY